MRRSARLSKSKNVVEEQPVKKNVKKVEIKELSGKKLNVRYRGQRIYQMNFSANKPMTQLELTKAVIQYFANHKDKDRVLIMVSALYPIGWRSGPFSSTTNPQLWNPKKNYEHINVNAITRFSIYMMAKPKTAGGDDNGKNDCLYIAIKKALGSMPDSLDKPHKLKKLVGVGRSDRIPITALPTIEACIRCSFTVSGDHTYVSQNPRIRNINLALKNGHYDLRCNEGRTYSKERIFNRPVPEKDVVTIKFNEDEIWCYDGKWEKTITYEEYKQLTEFKSRKVYVVCKDDADLVDEREKYIQNAKELLEMDKLTNMFRTSFTFALAVDVWRMMSKSLTQGDELDAIEGIWIDKAFRGGMHYAKEYTGYGIDYDINSMYPYYMSNKYFTFPITKGEYLTITNESLQSMKYYPYGIYRCVIEGEHMLFTPSINNHYTHFDLTLAKELGLTIRMIEDGQANCLHYKTRVNGDKAFGTYVNHYYPLKQKDSRFKPMLNSLWGGLCSKNKKFVRIDDDSELVDIDDMIDGIEPMGEKATLIKTVDSQHIFRTTYARLGTFLTSYCRLQLAKMIMRYTDKIVQINTDGFISTEELPLIISDEIGDFKIKNRGECTVYHANLVRFSADC